jgi:UDP-N-acetyl-D-mannosaminuronate dehydrogenase
MARVLIVGLGEVGRPLLELAQRSQHDVTGIDVAPTALPEPGEIAVMHVCYPFEIDDFVGETQRYIELIAPELTVINSTVAVGTTRAIHERTKARIAHSPVRGKHARMVEELTRYQKYVGAVEQADGVEVAAHFDSLGMPTRVLSSPEATELAKLTETTHFGLLIAWAQEVERLCDRVGADYDEVVSIYDEIDFFPPVKYFPGVIGGHCVLPHIEILSRAQDSPVLEAIRWSNLEKIEREADTQSG